MIFGFLTMNLVTYLDGLCRDINQKNKWKQQHVCISKAYITARNSVGEDCKIVICEEIPKHRKR